VTGGPGPDELPASQQLLLLLVLLLLLWACVGHEPSIKRVQTLGTERSVLERCHQIAGIDPHVGGAENEFVALTPGDRGHGVSDELKPPTTTERPPRAEIVTPL
jgi:hypothetical protein